MDETGLFYRALSRRTYVSESEGNRSSVRGSKALSAKDRLTLVLCVNATRTFKVPPLIIGTAKNPYCFRDSPCPLPYTTQKNAWMDRTVYNEWRNTVFLPAVRAFIDDPVALLMDNCPGHDRFFVDPEGQYINLSTKA